MFFKISLLRVYISFHKFESVCISETYPNSIIALNDNSSDIAASMRGEKERWKITRKSLTLKLSIFEILIGRKLCNFVSSNIKSVHIRSYSGSYFCAFALNTERYSVSLRTSPFPFTKKVISKPSKITVLCLYSQFVASWLNV